MNQFGKVCVVFLTAASLAFVAFAVALGTGGRNWQAEADDLTKDFAFVITPGEKVSYEMTERNPLPGAPAVSAKSTVLAEAVTKASAQRVKAANDRLKELTEKREQLEPGTKAALDAIAADEQGLKVREQALVAQVEAVNAEIARISDEILAAVNEVQRIRALGQERREEGYRLKNQLELLRNDLSVATIQRKSLEEEELRLKEILQRLERRNRQLTDSTGSGV